MKKWITVLLLGLCLSLAACTTAGTSDSTASQPTELEGTSGAKAGQVRIFNEDPQLQAAWEALGAEYTQQTGVEVRLVSDAGEEATLLTVKSGESLPETCADLSGTEACAQLASWDLTLSDESGRVCGIAAEVEVFGLMYNSMLLAQTSNTCADITCFTDLTEVVYAITDNQQKLGFSAFARVDPDENFAMQLSALRGDTRNLVDLIINNTPCSVLDMEENTEAEALQDFLDGKAVFFLVRSGAYETLNAIGSQNLGVLPVYLGSENEENQSLCVAAAAYWCVNESAAAEDMQATLDFLNYLVQPRIDGSVPVDDLGRLAPYRQAAYVSNMLEVVFRTDLAAGKAPLVCRYVTQAPEGLGQALVDYARDPSDSNWEAVAAIIEKK